MKDSLKMKRFILMNQSSRLANQSESNTGFKHLNWLRLLNYTLLYILKSIQAGFRTLGRKCSIVFQLQESCMRQTLSRRDNDSDASCHGNSQIHKCISRAVGIVIRLMTYNTTFSLTKQDKKITSTARRTDVSCAIMFKRSLYFLTYS